MIESQLGDSLIGHISRDSTAIEAREKVANTTIEVKATEPVMGVATEVMPALTPQTTPVPAKPKRGRPRKAEVRPPAPESPLQRQSKQSLPEMLAELAQNCSVGTKKSASGYKISWGGYKLHLDTACCGVIISAVLTGAAVHDSRVALPLSLMSAQRVDYLYELMDGRLLQQHHW